VADLRLLDERGQEVATVHGIRIARMSAGMLRARGAAIDDLLYDVVWRAAGRVEIESDPGSFLPDAQEMADAADARAGALAVEHQLSKYDTFLPRLDRACGAYVTGTLVALGVDFTPGRRLVAAVLPPQLGVLPRHHRLFATMLDMLEQDGVLERFGAEYEVRRGRADLDLDPDADCAALAEQQPAFAAQARIMAACGRHLAGVLRGEVDPLHLLFPNGSFELTEALYQHGPFAQAYNTLVQDIVRHVVAAVPLGRTLRCVEIGAGTGGTSAFVLPTLPADRTEYWYTDLSKLFMTRAAEKFRPYPFVKYELLDIERDPAGQGFARGQYDLVIASNALHATADLRVTMSHVLGLLAPGGLLVLLEGTERQRWVDLTFGLLEGWWKFTDHDVRPSYPLLTQASWRSLLAEVGFVDVDTAPRRQARQAVVLARAPLASASEVAPRRPEASRTWVIAGEHAGLAGDLAAGLAASGATTHLLDDAPQFWASALGSTLAANDGHVEVVHISRLGGEAPEGPRAASVVVDALVGIAALVRGISEAPPARSARLWLATCGAQSPTGDTSAARPLQAPEWGLGRVIALEHPERWGGLVDLDPLEHRDAQAATLVRAIVSSDDEDQVVVRAGVRHVPRIVRARAEAPASLQLRPDATYMVTGGTGGIAVPLARWLADRGARHLLLTSRQGLQHRSDQPDTAAGDAARQVHDVVIELEGRGVHVEVVACDVADETALAALIATCGVGRPALRGVMHAAAAMSSSPVRDLDAATLASMLAAKIDGTNTLDRLTRSLDLDFFVLFSSTTALWGVSGLGHYAAANEYLDAVAGVRASRGLPALSVNWGTWEQMRLATDEDRRAFAQGGLRPLASSDALDRLGRLISAGVQRKVVASVDWEVFKSLYEARRVRPLLREVGPIASASQTAPAATGGTGAPAVVERLREAGQAQRLELLVEYIQEQVAHVLGLPAGQTVPVSRGLFEMGMDSLMSVELKNTLESGLRHRLPSTLTFNYPNVAALAGFLMQELELESGRTDTEPAAASWAASSVVRVTDDETADAMSEDELEALLSARLGGIR
jgi:SAM-dependent methyltransferase/NAD(P)-dependent dehydrogenase (short-subunit alcohol dehydrogenase family)/acyl carrier protein